MAYTPVPAVAADDWIDEIFINTYWVDNMAAMVPDVFSAKGQLAVGLGVDTMGVLNVGSNGKVLMADSTQTLGMKWELPIVLFEEKVTNTSWDGDNKPVATTVIAANTFNASLPNSARALLLSVSARWAAASNANFVNIRCDNLNGGNGVVVRAQVANVFQDNFGIVTLDSSGEFAIQVGGAAADVIIDVWGYLL